MLRGRHSLVPTTSRGRAAALVTAPLVTLAVVATGVAAADDDRATESAGAAVSAPRPSAADLSTRPTEERRLGTSRSQERVALVDRRPPEVARKLWSTAPLKIRVKPTEGSRSVGTFPEDERIGVTGERRAGYAEVVVDEQARWVTASYLSRTKVVEKAPGAAATGGSSGRAPGISGAPCPDGSDVEAGLQPAAVRLYRAVCAAFPELSTYFGQDARGEHGDGRAIDFMTYGADLGARVRDFVFANRAALGLSNIIHAQQIWSSERSGEGFRPMEDRGSITANHIDHVHVLVN